MSDFFKADVDILYILVGENYYPIGCLTNNGFDDQSETVNTTTRDNEGWNTSIPTNQSYSINFDGIETELDSITGLITFKDLQNLKITKTLVSYILGTLDGKRTEGRGYITNLTKESPAGDLVSFTGVLTGFGKYSDYDPTTNNFFNYNLNFYI